jgi:type I restriction enzyme S subunit
LRLKAFSVAYPDSLREQERIVRILDEALDGIAIAKAKSEASIAAVAELLDAELEAAIKQSAREWPSERLESLCKQVTVGHVGPMKQEYQPDGIPFLRSQNIRPFELALDNVYFVSGEFHRQLSKSALSPGDVAIVRTGYPGTAAVVPDTLPIANCADLVIARPGPRLEPQFLAAFLNSHTGRRMVGAELVGAAQKHFNVTSAKQALVPVPPLDRQRVVVDQVTSVRRESALLRSRLDAKANQLTRLSAGLLHRAFVGGL